MAAAYVPDRGDIVSLDLEVRGRRRTALVVSPREYNVRVGLAQICPVTPRITGYPFEVIVTGEGRPDGAVLSDQLRNLDWRARNARLIARAPSSVVDEVLAKIGTLLCDS